MPFLQISIEKCIINIQLFNHPISCWCNWDNYSDGSWFHYRTKRFIEVKACNLMQAFSYQPSFVLVNSVIRILFNFENPLASYFFSALW